MLDELEEESSEPRDLRERPDALEREDLPEECELLGERTRLEDRCLLDEEEEEPLTPWDFPEERDEVTVRVFSGACERLDGLGRADGRTVFPGDERDEPVREPDVLGAGDGLVRAAVRLDPVDGRPDERARDGLLPERISDPPERLAVGFFRS